MFIKEILLTKYYGVTHVYNDYYLISFLRYLFANYRRWSKEVDTTDTVADIPDISDNIEVKVIDLMTMKLMDRSYKGHTAESPNESYYFVYLDVNSQWVAR